MIFQNIILFLFGTALGSAGNALIDRLPRKESWINGRSHCDKCGHVLAWFDLIPVFSYLSLGGKCRYCQSPIPPRNLIFELFIGFAFVFLESPILSLIFWVTMVLAVMDGETRLVSEFLIVVWGILALTQGFDLLGMLVGILLIGGIWALSKGKAMGFGDVEIIAVMGLSLGFPKIVVGLWIAFVSGAIAGMIYLILKKMKSKSVIAFGPFLVFGYWGAYFWGDFLLKYFLGYA